MMADFDVQGKLDSLSLPNKIKLLSGLGWWHTEPIPEAGIPSLRMSDGPNGVRGTRMFNGVPSSCFPASTGLGASFDVDLAKRVGQALGDEARAKSCHVLLAPTVNTQRSPLGGRGFESFSEDPHLNGTIAAAYINGLQSKGVAATIKHYVANDQEFQRFSISSEVSERALREIYLKPFQIAIKHSDPWALMTSYGRVNGVHVSENKTLLDDILRKEWDYKGTIVSDWTGVYSTTESIKAGLDLEMPGPTVMRGNAVGRALVAQKLFPHDIDARVRKILELLKHAHKSGIPFDGGEVAVDTPALRQLLRVAAADAIVLLKNDKGILPLSSSHGKDPWTIAVIGPNAKPAMTSGGGSAQLLSTYSVSPLQGIVEAAMEVGASVKYAIGAASHKYLPVLDQYIQQYDGQPGALLEFWNESPTVDFLDTKPTTFSLKSAVWSTPTRVSNCFLIDGVDETKVNQTYFLRYSARFIPDEDGDWEIGLNLSGRGNLFIDEKLIVDLSTNPVQGESFFGLGTVDVRTIVKGLKGGQAYDLEVRLSNESFISRGSPFPCRGGIRLGGFRHFEEDEAIAEAVQLAKDSDVAILVVGLNHEWESEGFDRKNMDLPGATNRLVSEVLRVNPNTVVVCQSGTPVTMPWVEDAKTVLQAFYGGNELGNGLADVLFGKVNPSGKLPLSFPKRLEDSPSYPSFGDNVQEYGKVVYNEGIFVGYRGYEIKDVAPLFPFGYGLSYTTFGYSELKTSPITADGRFDVSFTIQNVGQVAGHEVAQIYISDPQSSLPRPVKELKGFVKVGLDPGHSETVTCQFDREALSFYDSSQRAWFAEAGQFEVFVASSSRIQDIKLKGRVELVQSFSWSGL